MTRHENMVIEKETWDDLADSANLKQKDEIEQRAKQGTLIVKDGDVSYRPVEVPEIGWQLQKLPRT